MLGTSALLGVIHPFTQRRVLLRVSWESVPPRMGVQKQGFQAWQDLDCAVFALSLHVLGLTSVLI